MKILMTQRAEYYIMSSDNIDIDVETYEDSTTIKSFRVICKSYHRCKVSECIGLIDKFLIKEIPEDSCINVGLFRHGDYYQANNFDIGNSLNEPTFYIDYVMDDKRFTISTNQIIDNIHPLNQYELLSKNKIDTLNNVTINDNVLNYVFYESLRLTSNLYYIIYNKNDCSFRCITDGKEDATDTKFHGNICIERVDRDITIKDSLDNSVQITTNLNKINSIQMVLTKLPDESKNLLLIIN